MCVEPVKLSVSGMFELNGYTPLKGNEIFCFQSCEGFEKRAIIQTSGGGGEVLVLVSAAIYHEKIRRVANLIWPRWWGKEMAAMRVNYAYLAQNLGYNRTSWIYKCDAPEVWKSTSDDMYIAFEEVCGPWLDSCNTFEGFISVSQDVRFGLAAYSRPITMALMGEKREGLLWAKNLASYSNDYQYKKFIDSLDSFDVSVE